MLPGLDFVRCSRSGVLDSRHRHRTGAAIGKAGAIPKGVLAWIDVNKHRCLKQPREGSAEVF